MNNQSTFALSRRTFLVLGGSLVTMGLVPSVGFAEDDVLSTVQDAEAEYTFMPDDALTEDQLEMGEDGLASLASSSSVCVSEISGVSRYETAVAVAQAAYSSSQWAVVASGESWADSIAGAGLAGALKCPIVLCTTSSFPDVSADCLKGMGVKSIIVLGGTDVINTTAFNSIKSQFTSVTRIAGQSRYETQMKIYEYGKSKSLWDGDTAVIASGMDFADALAASPISYALHAPVFFVDGSLELPSAQKQTLSAVTSFKNFLVLGGTARISSNVQKFCENLASKREGTAKRLAGASRYETSGEIARYAVSNLGFSWDGVAFASGLKPYDALSAAALQGKNKRVLLLADTSSSNSASYVAAGQITSSVQFLGGLQAIPSTVRARICNQLGLSAYSNVITTSYGISLDRMATLEASASGSGGYSKSEFLTMLNPSNYAYGSKDYAVFSVLNDGYSGLTASQLDSYVAANCTYQESSRNCTSKLRGMGAAFVSAARTTGVNEAYLLSHAIWESAWGCSDLARGWTPTSDGVVVNSGVSYPYYKGTTYYNFYGIGAVDSNALSGGRAMAVKQGWTSPALAIAGAALWIANNYLNRSAGRQNTLYLMKFDLPDAVKSGSVWHQYCTGGNSWAKGIAKLMCNCYSKAGYSISSMPIAYDVPNYTG